MSHHRSVHVPELSQQTEKIEKPVKIVFVINMLICLISVMILLESGSYIVIAVLIHQLCDVAVPAIVMYTQYSMIRNQEKFPAGRTRLEPIGILVCALIMIEVSISVVYFASQEIYDIFLDVSDFTIDITPFSMLVMIVSVILNIALWIFCRLFDSPSMMTLATECRNDTLHQSVAFTAVCLISYFGKYIWLDPVGAIFVSLFIIRSWYRVGLAQINKLLGIKCKDEYMVEIHNFIKRETNCDDYTLIGYHIGRNLLIELQLILFDYVEYNQLCDLCNHLQHKLEEFDFIERAFVTFDCVRRDIALHKMPSLCTIEHVH
eukprot:69427_1